MDHSEGFIGTKLDLLTDLYKVFVSERKSMMSHLPDDIPPFSRYLQVVDHRLLPNVFAIVAQKKKRDGDFIAVDEIHCSFTEFVHCSMLSSSMNIRIEGQKGMSDDVDEF